jgi:hypothetical protein
VIPPSHGAELSLLVPEGGMTSATTTSSKDTKPKAGATSASKKAGTKDADKAGEDKTDKAKDADEPAEDKPAAAAGGSSAVEIVWLPDYCQQYAISSRTVLATSAVKYTLAQGWQLTQLDTTADSTAVINKVLDVVGNVLVARAGGAGGGKGDGASTKAKAEELQSGEAKYLRHIKIYYLKPGVYALFQYPKANEQHPNRCAELPEFSFESFKEFETSERWEELPLVSKQ